MRLKRSLFTLTLVLGAWALVELAAFLLLSATGAAWAWPGRLAEARAAVGEKAAARASGEVEGERHAALGAYFPGMVIHPFLGYVLDTDRAQGLPLSPEGFSRTRGAPLPPAEPRFTVGIFGGSMAMLLCHDGWEVLARQLARLPQAQGKRMWLECYALGGYKQPQGLIALNYALARGDQLDLVLTLDGFNGFALPTAENLRWGVNPFYPRQWQLLAATALTPQVLRVSGEISYLEDRRASWAGLCDGALAWSSVCHAVWQAREARLDRRVHELDRQLLAARPAGRAFAVAGPGFPYPPQGKKTYRELVAFWARSAELMAEICRAQGIPYFHFLQPNQYVAGSKPMGEAERKVAIDPDHPYRPAVEKGYPLLAAAGKRLVEGGIAFHDLTQIFAGIDQPLYFDACCHVNAQGSQIMAREMADRVRAAP